MAGTGRNYDDIAGLEMIGHSIPDRGGVLARAVELTHGLHAVGPLPGADQAGTGLERGRSFDRVIELADIVVRGHRVLPRPVKLSAIHDAHTDLALADIDGTHLLVGKVVIHGALGVSLKFAVVYI